MLTAMKPCIFGNLLDKQLDEDNGQLRFLLMKMKVSIRPMLTLMVVHPDVFCVSYCLSAPDAPLLLSNLSIPSVASILPSGRTQNASTLSMLLASFLLSPRGSRKRAVDM